MNHSFKVEIAEKYGIEKAVMLENFYFWVKKNEANKKNLHKGKAYTYNTAEAFAKLFPYIKERKIAQILREMESKDGLLISGQFHNYDRTKSYTLTDKALKLYGEKVNKENPQQTENEEPIIQNSDNGKSENCNMETTKKGDCLNTDINADEKQDINIKAKKPVIDYDLIFNRYYENHKKLYEQGKLQTDKACVSYGKDNKLIESLLKTFSYDDIILVLDRAMTDDFCINNGYVLSPILAVSVFSRLLNAKPQMEEKQEENKCYTYCPKCGKKMMDYSNALQKYKCDFCGEIMTYEEYWNANNEQ